MPSETPKRARKRRNFAREIERIGLYLDVIIRVKEPDESASSETAAQLRSLRDLRAYMAEMQNGGAK